MQQHKNDIKQEKQYLLLNNNSAIAVVFPHVTLNTNCNTWMKTIPYNQYTRKYRCFKMLKYLYHKQIDEELWLYTKTANSSSFQMVPACLQGKPLKN